MWFRDLGASGSFLTFSVNSTVAKRSNSLGLRNSTTRHVLASLPGHSLVDCHAG